MPIHPQVAQLPHDDLAALVQQVIALLYEDVDNEGRAFLNPDKSWAGADVCAALAELLEQYDLVPPPT